MNLEEDNPNFLDPHPSEQAPETEPAVVVPAFRLIQGMEYVTASKQVMKVLHEIRGQFIGMIEMPNSRPCVQWYFADGTVERDLDKFPDQDPFDVIRINRAPDVVYLLRDNLTLAYSSNSCFLDRDAAVKAAVARKLQIVAFKEVMDD